MIETYFLTPALTQDQLFELKHKLNSYLLGNQVSNIESEFCFYVELKNILNDEEEQRLTSILKCFNGNLSKITSLTSNSDFQTIVEIGPRLNFSTPFSTNAVSICSSVKLPVTRLERSTRYIFQLSKECDSEVKNFILSFLYDRMTECVYECPLSSFKINVKPQTWEEIDVLNLGTKALEDANHKLGLAFDAWDIQFYTSMFRSLNKNPTTVEIFDLAQSNSEHSRHWFFKSNLIIDGTEMQENLFQMIMKTQNNSNPNNVIKFSDNSSAIKGFNTSILMPNETNQPSDFKCKSLVRHITFTAETHNFPTGVSPFSGAATGTGGRIRDIQAAGRGAHVIAGTAAYCFGNLNIPGYTLPWEDDTFEYPTNFALPINIAIEASNGASDYGNKFGEPIISGFSRSFGMKLPNGERREWIKPIMFTGGIGSIDENYIRKKDPKDGMVIVKVGGPVYRIGVGGGAASSIHIQGDQKEELDFGAVQRGDPEMEQKMNRVIRACIENSGKNIILSIHDQGAGGNGNVLKEIVEGAGAEIYVENFDLGDPTISVLELWGAEYQESNALLIDNDSKLSLVNIADREKCPINFVGKVNESGFIRLIENKNEKAKRNPVDLELSHVLGSVPAKTFTLQHIPIKLCSLKLPFCLSLESALDRVLRLPSVASKRYLTNKVDRSVTGLIAQQQCVGPLHTPLADVAVIALSYFDIVGSATAIGEQPIKGLLNPAAGARMSVAEALTNIVFAKISSLQDIKCSGNWMFAAKLPGEGAALYDACKAMCSFMRELGIAIDGGKDSLSMAARVGKETVKSPGSLVISAYAPCPDIRKTVTPDLKCPDDKGVLICINLSNKKHRLGGTAFAQCFKQLGDETPDIENAILLKNAFLATQTLIEEGKISAGHDISDGGFITCVLEMAFAGNCGIDVNVNSDSDLFSTMFHEEAGWVLEIRKRDLNYVINTYRQIGIEIQHLGSSYNQEKDPLIIIKHNNETVLSESVKDLRDTWEATSFELELRQTNKICVKQERENLLHCKNPSYMVSFDMTDLSPCISHRMGVPRVAVLREEGINGDREMVASLFMAGFEVWDVTMTDLLSKKIDLFKFQGLVFPGGFSYADVLGSACGWSAGVLFNDELKQQFTLFKNSPLTFSLGVCNGCQLMARLGWVTPTPNAQDDCQHITLAPNLSGRFESRFVTVKIQESPSIMMKGMENSILGVWIAHGEGRFLFKDINIMSDMQLKNLIPMVYTDDIGSGTETYPLNPNGSPCGIAALCSEDGRHIAMMPHPERCILPWQWAWLPEEWKDLTVSPWLKMFKNAYDWCKNRNE